MRKKGNKFMSMMVADLYDALKDAGAKEKLARGAAEAVANYDKDISELKSDMKLVKWMIGFNMAMTATIMFKLFGVN